MHSQLLNAHKIDPSKSLALDFTLPELQRRYLAKIQCVLRSDQVAADWKQSDAEEVPKCN